jgi:hypothetical protein
MVILVIMKKVLGQLPDLDVKIDHTKYSARSKFYKIGNISNLLSISDIKIIIIVKIFLKYSD